MSKVQFLVLSSFASGFGLCSVIFAGFTMTYGLSFISFLTFVLTLVFFVINLFFAFYYYTFISKQLSVMAERRSQLSHRPRAVSFSPKKSNDGGRGR